MLHICLYTGSHNHKYSRQEGLIAVQKKLYYVEVVPKFKAGRSDNGWLYVDQASFREHSPNWSLCIFEDFNKPVSTLVTLVHKYTSRYSCASSCPSTLVAHSDNPLKLLGNYKHMMEFGQKRICSATEFQSSEVLRMCAHKG